MEAFLTQVEKLPAVWLPFVIALAIAGTLIWKTVERLHQAKIDAHSARESVTQAKLDLLETQLAELKRSASQPHILPTVSLSLAPAANSGPQSVDLPTTPLERVYVPDSVDAKFLLVQKQGQTNYQGGVRVQPYLGKWMKLSGTLVEVLYPKGQNGITTWIRSDSMGEPPLPGMLISDVIATFDDQLEWLKVAQVGDRITLHGEVRNIDMDAVMLDHCQLERS